MEENKKPEFQMTDRQYFEMKLVEVATTQLAFNKACETNLKLLTENFQHLLKTIERLEFEIQTLKNK